MSVAAIPARLAPAIGIARIFAPDTLLQFALGVAILGTGVGLALGNLYLAYAFTFAAMFGVTLLLPGTTPFLVIFAFLFQNTFVAFAATWVKSTEVLDQMRALNVIMLAAVFTCFLVTGQFSARVLPRGVRPWVNATWLVFAVVGLYFALGLALGNGKDAIIYLRGIVVPLMCLQIALVCGARFRVPLAPALLVATLLIIVYGYCELIFETRFLSLFNGDRYLWLKMQDDIVRGVYTRLMQETGFVLRGIDDMMRVSLFNLSGSDHDAIKIFRLSGPNFHPISFGYALALLSAWLFANRVRWVAILALPLLIFVGSKGAIVLFLLFFFMLLAMRLLPARVAMAAFLVVLGLYIAAVVWLGLRVGDYHVLGLMAGIRDFLANPLGHGVGSGGVMSAAGSMVDWGNAQGTGATDIPVESAIAVLLYQLGIGATVFVGLLVMLARRFRKAYLASREPLFLFAFVAIATICANAVFQEEAFFAPLALGLCLMLTGLSLGALSVDERRDTRPLAQGAVEGTE